MKMRQIHHNARRRGTAYIAVLGMSMLLMVVGFSLVTVSRINTRMSEQSTDFAGAQDLARAGLEFALLHIENTWEQAEATNNNWRDAYISGAVNGPTAFNGGSFEWVLEDADGNFSDDPTDSFTITVTATVGSATYMLRGDMQPTTEADAGPALNCLNYAVVTNQLIRFDNATFTADQAIHSNDNVTATAPSDIYADVHGVNGVTGGTYHGTNNTAATAVTLPGSDVFDYYLAHGTVIDYSALQNAGSGKKIEKQVLSPGVNPWGTPNAAGIYIIDCGGTKLEIKRSRIIGTLIVTNTNELKIMNEVNWEPAIANYPAVLCSGTKMQLELADGPLIEADESTNFNPTGAPWQSDEDNDQNDTYPNVIAGLIYSTGKIEIKGGKQAIIEGIVLGDDELDMDDNSASIMTVTHRSIYQDAPPPGFREAAIGKPHLVAGSLQRVVN